MSEAKKKRRMEVNQPMAERSPRSIPVIGGHTDDTIEEDADMQARSQTWISWFCSLRGNEFFCEVDKAYLQKSSNFFGLREKVPFYNQALDLISEFENLHDDTFFKEQNESVKLAAEKLYGLIHARYILTNAGLAKMRKKFLNADFGTCPRVYCSGQQCLPVGQTCFIGATEVRIYCPKCEEMYKAKCQSNPDGAYFDKTFPHLFLMTYTDLKPPKASEPYVPRVHGFKIHKPQGHN